MGLLDSLGYPANSTPTLQVRTCSVVVYPKFEPRAATSALGYQKQQTALREARKYSGQMSDGSVRRLKKAVSLMLQSNPKKSVTGKDGVLARQYKVGFVTLTISDSKLINHKEAYTKGLALWLKWATRTMQVTQYIWKAELQKRGQIHYHILINEFIHYKFIRAKWNDLQRRNGWLDGYYSDKGHYDANSTDVHALYDVKNVEAYIAKYVSKQAGPDEIIEGKVWDCSKNLKGAKYWSCDLTEDNLGLLLQAESSGSVREFQANYCTFFSFNHIVPTALLEPTQQSHYRNYLSSLKYSDPMQLFDNISSSFTLDSISQNQVAAMRVYLAKVKALRDMQKLKTSQRNPLLNSRIAAAEADIDALTDRLAQGLDSLAASGSQ